MGWTVSGRDESRTVSGVGRFDFKPAAGGDKLREGSGWFTTGSVERREFARSSGVRLWRVERSDIKTLDTHGIESQSLVAKRYSVFSSLLGRRSVGNQDSGS